MPINPDAFIAPEDEEGNAVGSSPMSRWLSDIKAIHTELRRVTARFGSGAIEAGGRITAGQRTKLDNRFDVLVARLKNRMNNVP